MHAANDERPFDSIESAQEFMDVLAETILDAMNELSQEQHSAEQNGLDRRTRAVELARFKLKTLMCHVHKSRRMLNDLRMIRRLILDERTGVERVLAAR